MHHCLTHPDELAEGTCRTCHGTYCTSCLVYAYGRVRSPYCVRCALLAVGTTPSEAWLADYSVSA
jgi:hypothetical protein